MTTLAEVGGWPVLLGKLVAGDDLSEAEASAGLAEILSGDATAAQISAFVVALRAKGETAGELAGLLTSVLAARVPVVLAPDVRRRAVDIVGTGGDRSHSVNVSTMSALVVAGAAAAIDDGRAAAALDRFVAVSTDAAGNAGS